jgi:type II secretory pathway pseudopilin PulG
MVEEMKKHRQEFEDEGGYVLLAVIFMTMLVLISLAIAAPKMAMSIQRDKELETIHRGQQYKRAIKLYYQKFGSYPTSIDQLVQTNQIRFLRKRYTDPMTGKDDWKPVFFGQAHVRPLGFFGQPLMVATGMGGTSGAMYAVATTTTTDANGVPIASTDSTGGTDGSSTGSNAFPGNTQGTSSTSSGSGSSNSISSMFQQPSSGSGSGPSSSSPTGGTGTGGSGTSATTFGGGGPIVGFTLPINKPSLVLYKLQTRYNKWEFNYDPAEDQAQALAGLTNGASTGGVPTNGTGPGSTTPGSIPPPPPTSAPPVTDPGSTGGSNPGSNPTGPPTGPTDPTSPQ